MGLCLQRNASFLLAPLQTQQLLLPFPTQLVVSFALILQLLPQIAHLPIRLFHFSSFLLQLSLYFLKLLARGLELDSQLLDFYCHLLELSSQELVFSAPLFESLDE